MAHQRDNADNDSAVATMKGGMHRTAAVTLPMLRPMGDKNTCRESNWRHQAAGKMQQPYK